MRHHLNLSQSHGIVNGHMNVFITLTTGGALASISGNPLTDAIKAGELFGVNVVHGTWPCPLVATHRLCGLQVLEPVETQGLDHPANGGKRRRQNLGHSSERAALMAEVNCALQLLWIERPPLGAANTASIHKSSSTA